MSTTKAVILARGLGTRMRRNDEGASLDHDQIAAADAGMKAMIPIGRPFLDYVISALADAGFTDVCLVIGPEHQAITDYYGALRTERVRVHLALQQQPRGTADAVLAAETFAAGDDVVALNSDNYYPVHTLRMLRELDGAGVAAFERETLVRLGNIPRERVARYSIVDFDEHGMLTNIVEKPDAAVVATRTGELFVGMNSWCLPPSIYEACRRITRSERGELELPSAVQYAVDMMNIPFRVLTFRDGVLDLSSRGDIAAVAAALHHIEPRL